MEMLTYSTCADCLNDFRADDLTAEMLCESCAPCCENPKLPNGVNVTYGTAIATCSYCSYRCAYWECACELVHECNKKVTK